MEDKRRKELTDRLDRIEKQLFQLYGSTYRAALGIRAVREAIETGANFTWQGNPAAEKQLDRYLRQLSTKATAMIQSGITSSWETGEARAGETIAGSYAPKLQGEAARISGEATREQRRQGMTAHAFATQERGGLTVSGRVWNLQGNAKRELETMIQNGILEGKSPHEVSRDIRKYLNNPDALFRRVRNPRTGDLELSQAARDYRPGTGIYRSAYKNARRLAVTEMNAAYRRAQWEGYQQNPLVVGYEIRLSANHTTTVKGRTVPLEDICDRLAGRYPKTFLWTGWHPQCRCDMIPVLITEADFKERIKARKNGTLAEWKPRDWQSRQVKALPRQAREWATENAERISSARSLPDWVERNNVFFLQPITADLSKATSTQGKPTKEETSTARTELEHFYRHLLPKATVGKFEARRLVVETSDNCNVVINKTFYKETISKYKTDPLYKIKLKYAEYAHEIIKVAKRVLPDEQGEDHPDAVFRVYGYTDGKYRVELKVKCNTDGNFLHIIRLYPK